MAKTNGNDLKSDQVQAYMDIAARRGYEAVITLSNDVALEGKQVPGTVIGMNHIKERRKKTPLSSTACCGNMIAMVICPSGNCGEMRIIV